jgi:hypothetical protein
MKNLFLLCLVAVFSIWFSSCQVNNISPQQSIVIKNDTSTTLIQNIALVGYWNIVTDTISYQGNNVMYHGTAADHYIFTKYGNLYIKEGLDNLIDTAIYNINSLTYSTSWVNSYLSVNGVISTTASSSAPFAITSVDTASMVLTSNYSTGSGQRYEQLTFKKVK